VTGSTGHGGFAVGRIGAGDADALDDGALVTVERDPSRGLPPGLMLALGRSAAAIVGIAEPELEAGVEIEVLADGTAKGGGAAVDAALEGGSG